METTRSADGTVIAYDRQDHGAPPEVIAPVLTDFFLGSGSLDRAAPGGLRVHEGVEGSTGLRLGSSALVVL